MNPQAVEKAQRKLARLHEALKALREASQPAAIEAAWENFVTASGGIYAALEQGSKSNGVSEGWFGRKKHDRKKDAALRYLKFARNAEEHGIKKIVDREHSSIQLASPGASVKLVSDGVSKWTVAESQGDIIYPFDIVVLTRVFDDRFGDYADPPRTHFGSDIEEERPIAVAEATTNYFNRLLDEASKLLLT